MNGMPAGFRLDDMELFNFILIWNLKFKNIRSRDLLCIFKFLSYPLSPNQP